MFTADFQILPSAFSDTEITFEAISAAAKQRFHGAVSWNIRKSLAPDFLVKLELEGYKVAV